MNTPCYSCVGRNPVTDNIDVWTSAYINKSTVGRGSNGKQEAYGIKKLRELILDLAVRGMLVSQDSNDEPASELLKKIAAEKEKFYKEKKIKNKKALSQIDDDEKMFELPISWEWVRLGDIQYFTNGFAFKSADLHDGPGVGVVKIGDVYRGEGIAEHKMQYVSNSHAKSIDSKYEILPGDLVITMTGDVKVGFNNTDKLFLLNQRVGKIKCFMVNPRYIYNQLVTVAEQKIEEASGGVIPNVSTSEINTTIISLPPEKEQDRIVAKVDELMALCDQLEQQQTDSIAAHQTLVETLLGTLTNVASPEEFQQAWNRIANHFDTLFTTEHSIDQLKQTILQLAVMGRLVSRNPRDDSAIKLVAQLKKETTRGTWITQNHPVIDDQIPFKLPSNWVWMTTQQISRDGHPITYGILKPIWEKNGIPTVRVTEMKTGEILVESLPKCQPARAEKFSKTTLDEGDLLISKDGTIGKTAFVPPELKGGNITQHVLRFPISKRINRYYIKICIDAPCIQQWIRGETKGVALKGINVSDFRRLPLPIPPLEEQHRIVTKVDELMTLCDTLKARIKDAQTSQTQLADTIVEQAVVQ